MELTEFMRTFATQLEKKAESILTPLYHIQDSHANFGSNVEPYPIQREVVRALKEGFKEKNALFITGEMGSGKFGSGKAKLLCMTGTLMGGAKARILLPPIPDVSRPDED